jgi:membrane fusion protein, multidrug efflux system
MFRFDLEIGSFASMSHVGVCVMNAIEFALRRPFTVVVLVVSLVSVGVLGSSKMGVDIFTPPNTPKPAVYLGSIALGAGQMEGSIAGHDELSFHEQNEQPQEEHQKIVLTSPQTMDVTVTQRYVCQIRSQSHIKISALGSGYLEEILVKEGQRVKKGDVLFKIVQTLYKAKRDAKSAEAKLAQLQYSKIKRLSERNPGKAVDSENDVALFEAELAKAKANAELAQAELNFTNVTAPFDGIVDRLHEQLGSMVKEGEILTSLSDNSVMWVYFNVPERRYLEYMGSSKEDRDNQKVELELANHAKFPERCVNVTVEGSFNNQTGNIPFRADFKNPGGLLRHGQTGAILVHRTLKNALVIPQRATFEILDKRYVWVVGKDDVAHQTLITIKHELEDVFVIDSGLEAKDKFVLEGTRQAEEGRKMEYEFCKPEEALKNQKFHAE